MKPKITTERHYKITLSDGSVYYGRTTIEDKRYYQHLGDARRGNHDNKNIQEVYNKYGYDDWVHEWLGYETGDLKHHREIELGYVQSDPKALNINTGDYILGDPKEYDRKKHIEKYDNMTPKELKEFRRKDREKKQLIRDNETPEERRIRQDKTNTYARQKRLDRKNI